MEEVVKIVDDNGIAAPLATEISFMPDMMVVGISRFESN